MKEACCYSTSACSLPFLFVPLLILLSIDEDIAEYIVGIVQDETIEDEEKREVIGGFLAETTVTSQKPARHPFAHLTFTLHRTNLQIP